MSILAAAPQNYNRNYMGPISIRQALACSQNIPAMRALGTFGGPARLLKLLENLGIRSIQGDAARYGLGLAIAHAIAEEHGGNLAAASDDERGTTFTLTLPTLPA